MSTHLVIPAKADRKMMFAQRRRDAEKNRSLCASASLRENLSLDCRLRGSLSL